MQSPIDEVSRELFRVRPFTRRVGEDEKFYVHAERQRTLARERLVSDLDGVTKRPTRIGFRPGATLQLFVMQLRQLGSFFGPRKQREEFAKTFFVPAKVRRELPENWPEFFAQTEKARGKKFASGTAESRSFFMCVMKRESFTLKMKSAGVSEYHFRKLLGRCRE